MVRLTMERSIGVAEAKAKFSELLDRAAAGEEITITRSGKPRARLMPPADPPKRKFGMMKGKWPEIPADVLLKPMSEEELRWAEGYYQNKDGIYTRAILRKLAKQGNVHLPRKTRKRGR